MLVIFNKLKSIFKNKIFRISFIVVMVVIVLFISSYLLFRLSLTINGDKIVYINYNEEYKDMGIKGILKNKVKTISNVDNTKVGSYEVIYSIKYLFWNIKNVRIVNVVDKINPVITLNGSLEVNKCPNKDYVEEGYSALDEYDLDLTDKVVLNISDDKIEYSVSDTSGNTDTVFRKLNNIDNEKPSLNLKGNSVLYVKIGSLYYDAGYEVSDNCDDTVSVSTNTNINTSSAGEYYYTYIATDTSGNTSEVSRKIIVYKEPGIGVIYLTFDDGPSSSGSTEKILNILKEEGVKATFFVTDGSADLIRREYNEGHSIGLHTNSHVYSDIYSSVDNYFNDLYAIENKVYNIIGIKPNIIRFPGGSNNTVSNRYSYGIMDTLTKEVVNRGYSYFDWNISSGDAGECYDSYCVYSNVVNRLSKNKNNVVLMHDIKMYTANALKDIITFAKSNNYTFKVLDSTTYPVRFK